MRVAVAEVAIRPDFTGFRQQLRDGVRAATAAVNAEIKVDADTRNAVRQIKQATRDQRVTVNVDVDHSTLGRFTKALGLAGKQAALFKLGVEGIRLAGLVGGLIAATGAATSFGGAAVGLVGALVPLAGLGATLPGILGGIGAGFGVVKLATAGIGDALKAGKLGSKEFAEALKELPVAARPFATFLAGLRPKLDELTRVAQTGFLPALQDGIGDLVRTYFPMFKTAVASAATVLSRLVDTGAEMMNSGPFRRDVQAIIGQTSTTLGRFGNIGLNLVDTMRHLTAAAIPLTDWLTRLFEKWSSGIREATETARANGSLAAFFERTKVVASALFGILGNVAKAFFNVIGAAAPLGSSVLVSLDRATAKLRAFTEGDENRAKLTRFFEGLRPTIEAVKLALKGAAEATVTLVAKLKEVADAAARFANAHPGIAKAVGQFAALAAIGKFTGILSLAGTIGTLATASLPLSLIVAGVVAVGAAGYLAYTKIKPFRDAIDELVRSVGSVVVPVFRTLVVTIVNQVIPAIQKALPFVRDQLVAGIKSFTRAVQENKPQLQALGNLLVTVGGWIASKVIPFLVQLWSVHLRALIEFLGGTIRVIGQVVGYFQKLAGWLGATKDKTKGASDTTAAYNKIVDQASAALGGLGLKQSAAASAMRTTNQVIAAQKQQLNDLKGATLGVFDADTNLRRAQITLQEAQKEVTRLQKEGKTKTDEYKNATLNLRDAQSGVVRAKDGFVTALTEQKNAIKASKDVTKEQVEGLIAMYKRLGIKPPKDLVEFLKDLKQKVKELKDHSFIVTARGAFKGPTEPFSGGDFAKRARGGPIPGIGNRDTVPAMLTPGEFVIRKRAVQSIGLDNLRRMNAMNTGGEVEPQRFALGGLVMNQRGEGGAAFAAGLNALDDAISKAVISRGVATMKQVEAAMAAAAAAGGGGGTAGGAAGIKAFIKSTDRLPYVWGGVGPRGYDCSGLTGEVYNRMRGRPSYRRAFTTASNFKSLGFKPGAGGTYSIGVTPGHHMAGEYGGLRFEAESTKTGIKIGSAASSVGSFPVRFHLNRGGVVPGNLADLIARGKVDVGGDPAGVRLAVGRLPRRATRHERIGVFHQGGRVNRDQLAMLQRGERVLSAAQERARVGRTPAMAGAWSINVDARGSSDPGAVEAAARRGAAAALSTYRQARVARPRR